MVALSKQYTAPPRGRYRAPHEVKSASLQGLLERTGRARLAKKQFDLLRADQDADDVPVYYAGDLNILLAPSVSIVGTREVSEAGALRARRLARELVSSGVVVVSGLAKGVDTAAHTSAIEHQGRTAAVIGTPLDKAYPAENAALQQLIYTDHLLLTPFRIGEPTFKRNFPKRNRVMAALSDATVIIEASDTSGTLHQAAECQRLKRWLFIMKSVVDDPEVTWPARFLADEHTVILERSSDILERIGAG